MLKESQGGIATQAVDGAANLKSLIKKIDELNKNNVDDDTFFKELKDLKFTPFQIVLGLRAKYQSLASK